MQIDLGFHLGGLRSFGWALAQDLLRSRVNESRGFIKGAQRAQRAQLHTGEATRCPQPGPGVAVLCRGSGHKASQKLRVNSSLVSSVIFVAPANTSKCTELGLWGFFARN